MITHVLTACMIADENVMGNQAEEWMKLKNIHESSFGVQHSISSVHVNAFLIRVTSVSFVFGRGKKGSGGIHSFILLYCYIVSIFVSCWSHTFSKHGI